MDFSDIFSGDTWDTVSNVLSNPLVQGGAALLGGLNGVQNARNLRDQTAGTVNTLNQLYSPNSPYAQQLRQQLERRDAAAGRRSQYGPRETELAAKLTGLQSGQLMNPQYQALLRGANTSPYGALAGSLGYLGQRRQNPTSSLVNSASKLNNLRKGYNTLSNMFSPAATGTEADLGGAASSLGETFGSGTGSLDVGGGMFGTPQELTLSPFSATNSADPFGSFASSVGNGMDYLGLGGAGDFGGAAGALSGMGAGSTAGTVGGMDTLGSLFGGTGYLPGYASTAGSSLFGAGAGEAAGGGLGAAAGMATPMWAYGPLGIAVGGMLGGLFGMGDNGNPYTQANDAFANAIVRNPDFAKNYTGGDVTQYMNQNGITDFNQAQEQLGGIGGGGSFFSNFLGNGSQDYQQGG